MPAPDQAHAPAPLFELVGGLSKAMDLISPQVVDHHARVASIAVRMGTLLDLSPYTLAELVFAGLTHDIGAFSYQVRLDALDFETDQVAHAEVGWRLLRRFPNFERIATVVRYHHVRHEHSGNVDAPADLLESALLVNLADRVDVCLRHMDKAAAPDDLMQCVAPYAGTWFAPQHAEALDALVHKPEFWRELAASDQRDYLKKMADPLDEWLFIEEVTVFSHLFSQIIDFRSRFTATHSRGVAATGTALMRLACDDENACKLMRVAGNLHDLGKLAVPRRLLDKPGKLDDREYAAVQRHADYTRGILSSIPGMTNIAAWAGNHHERLDGNGYPQELDAEILDVGSRVLAVADVFTALTEDRPYRSGMGRDKALGILNAQAGDGILDAEAVGLLAGNFDDLNAVRIEAQGRALADFENFSARV